MRTPLADIELARLLEGVAADEARRWVASADRVRPGDGAQVLDVAGGTALYAGPCLPVSAAVGLGLRMPVTSEDLDVLEGFYAAHDAPVRVVVCPLADSSLTTLLAARGYGVTHYENVLYRGLDDVPPPMDVPGVEVRVAASHEADAWLDAVVRGFTAHGEPLEWEWRLGRLATAREGVTGVLAWADGRVVGTGELTIREGIGWLNGDTTAAGHRRRGVQQALQRFRLALARDAGCSIAVSEAAPGSGSQRNMERCGMRVAYTRIEMEGPGR